VALTFLLDENSLGPLWHAFARHNLTTSPAIDILAVGTPPGPASGTRDSDLLIWIETSGRILITNDKRTMPGHLANHLGAGGHCPGIFAIHRATPIARIVDFIALAAIASDADEWRDWIMYLD
jgi:hypothetical protein